ncbi:MAG: transposase [Patescibacteria group bacterium]
MNNRDYKNCSPGEFYHIYNRGNAKNDIFINDEDFKFFLLRLRQNLFPDEDSNNRIQHLPKGSFSLISYCLMPNHFHFIIKQNSEIPTSKLILKVCTSYSKYFNKKYERVGHVFQDRFKQVHINDNSYLIWLVAYVHQNPKVAGLIKNLKDYPWSSYRDFLGERGDNLCDKEIILSQFKNIKDFESFVEDSYDIIQDKKSLDQFMMD